MDEKGRVQRSKFQDVGMGMVSTVNPNFVFSTMGHIFNK